MLYFSISASGSAPRLDLAAAQPRPRHDVRSARRSASPLQTRVACPVVYRRLRHTGYDINGSQSAPGAPGATGTPPRSPIGGQRPTERRATMRSRIYSVARIASGPNRVKGWGWRWAINGRGEAGEAALPRQGLQREDSADVFKLIAAGDVKHMFDVAFQIRLLISSNQQTRAST
ncbi:hypothetical protein B0H11DRAFT_1907797 [Mycena galericulata]|nr:hypothetical protein B0H11DRAFT_1907797 [Mycena galericulata]